MSGAVPSIQTPAAALGPEVLQPELSIADPSFAWWAGQVILRLRREVAWQRRLGVDGRDPAQSALDLLRYREVRAQFFATDVAARYLTECIQTVEPVPGRFDQMADRIGLSLAERFVLTLGLLSMVDGAMAPVVALLEGDAHRSVPSLALAQTLWHEPVDVLAALDAARPLRRFGLVNVDALGSPIVASPTLARLLAADPSPAELGLADIEPRGVAEPALVRRFSTASARLEVVVLTGPAAADAAGFAAQLAGTRQVFVSSLPPEMINQQLLLAWVLGADLALQMPLTSRDMVQMLVQGLAQADGLSMRLYVHVTERDHVFPLPPTLLGPILSIPRQNEAERALWLGSAFAHLGNAVDRIARDFRLEAAETRRLAAALSADPSVDATMLAAAAQAECSVDFNGLAELLVPRYRRADIVLPSAVGMQLDEAIAAIIGASRLRYDWDRGRRLGEGGIPLLFAGVPGTGKTMAAEVIAQETGLPLYRIDLSQVVNKYIGETEKNLARVFDAAEKMRCILFFDEADALFGKRTEVKDANDRFANVETGYLLQRIDDFTGISVLATNRRKDLDEAFTRRLRYIIEFPVPEASERRTIWDNVFPEVIDTSQLDKTFLARQFQFTGGHIRSVALNAALQAAARGETPKVNMADVLLAARRELGKLRRKAGADVFVHYWHEIEGLHG